MLMTGADLIKSAGQLQERAAKLEIAASQEVKPANQAGKSALDEETQGALLRFARFIHKDGKQKQPSQKKTSARPGMDGNQKHPYIKAQQTEDRWFEVGQNIDIYV